MLPQFASKTLPEGQDIHINWTVRHPRSPPGGTNMIRDVVEMFQPLPTLPKYGEFDYDKVTGSLRIERITSNIQCYMISIRVLSRALYHVTKTLVKLS